MEIRTLVSILDQPHLAAEHLHGWGLADVGRGQRILLELAETGLTLDLLAGLSRQLCEHLPTAPDPDAALAALRRYLFAVRSPMGLAALFERDPSAMPALLSALSLGPQWTELLIDDPDALDVLLQSEGRPIDDAVLLGELLAELESFGDERSIASALARFRRRHLLRIAYCESTRQLSLDEAMKQLSALGQALVEGALTAATRRVHQSRPLPPRVDSKQLRYGVIALGQLGRLELNYALPLELLMIYDAPSVDSVSLAAIHDQFERVARLAAKLLDESTGDQQAPKVRLVPLPDSGTQAVAHAAEDVMIGFDSYGRTWHRQQILNARAVAGDHELCQSVLARLEPWLFRRYLSQADETGIKALKRRILVEANIHQDDWRNVRLARGGLDNMEAAIEFLQLLVGGERPSARRLGTLGGLAGLEQAEAITSSERCTLEESYRFLRRVAHQLQITFGPAAAEVPDDSGLVQRIAARVLDGGDATGLLAKLQRHLDESWQILRRLLGVAFEEDAPISREVELLLAPAPPPQEIRAALAPFGFDHPEKALQELDDLATEHVPFLSTRRCRHLLGLILPRLLCAIGATPNPDRTLGNLARVSNSLGGKGVLWDLFRFNPPTLDLYVRLCAASPYLSDILTTNPGMIDELVDSLQLDKLPTRAELDATLAELCRGASDTLPILHDFKNAEHLRIGVRDILGKEDIDETHAALADVAETCLAHVAQLEYAKLVEKYGVPTVGPGPSEAEPARLVIMGLGKLGGREPNYHSPLDVLFLYQADGTTRPSGRSRRQERTANNHFFTQLAQRIIKQLSELTTKGRLYTMDALLRPIGTIGALAVPLVEFQQHFASGAAPLWQWQALCQARPVYGEADAMQMVARMNEQLLCGRMWRGDEAAEIRSTRKELERGASAANIKRAAGGTLDVEFLVQMLQLKQAGVKPNVLKANTQSAIIALADAGALDAGTAEKLGDAYRFLRRVESGLRLLDTSARHDLPDDPTEMGRLALLLGHSNPSRLREQCLQYMVEIRAEFDRTLN
jgi:glutamate-ammonia-ligase adenylyltransferase